jgi:hypothetical protein
MNDIEKFCQKFLTNYTINSDGTIDVDDPVYLSNNLGDMEKLPVKFGKVYSGFFCSSNKLTTLEGCPYYVGGDFDCSCNKFTTLEYSPKYIGGWYCCRQNELTTLKGIEKCEMNTISLGFTPDIPPENYIYIITAKIHGKILLNNSEIESILNTYKNEVKYLHKALSELKKVVLRIH